MFIKKVDHFHLLVKLYVASNQALQMFPAVAENALSDDI